MEKSGEDESLLHRHRPPLTPINIGAQRQPITPKEVEVGDELVENLPRTPCSSSMKIDKVGDFSFTGCGVGNDNNSVRSDNMYKANYFDAYL